MKSVLRSAFEPVPRPLSPGVQLLVVGVLVVGIAISVVEYVESSRPPSLAEDQQALPVRIETQSEPRPNSAQPADLGARPRTLVRVTPIAGAAASDAPSGSASGTGAGSPAPMALQPGEDG
jgi:hypothetical protein